MYHLIQFLNMRTVQTFLAVFIVLVFLVGCSKENVEKEITPPVNLEFHKSLIGLWKSEIQIKNESESPRSTDMEISPFSGYRSYAKILFSVNTATINEWQEYYREDKMISETYLSQKCELVEVDTPYYTVLVTEGKNMGERMVLKYIQEKRTMEWEVYVSLGFIQNPKNFKKVD